MQGRPSGGAEDCPEVNTNDKSSDFGGSAMHATEATNYMADILSEFSAGDGSRKYEFAGH